MKKSRWLAAALCVLLLSSACVLVQTPAEIIKIITAREVVGVGEAVSGSGNIITEERAVSGFDRVAIQGIGKVIVTQGETEALTVEGDDNLLPYMVTEVDDNVLEISISDEIDKGINPTREIRFYLTVKDLEGLYISGAGDFEIDTLAAYDLDIVISGAGSVEIEDLEADSLNIHLSGAGDIDLGGVIDSQDVTISGAGDYDGLGLESRDANVISSGAGNAKVNVTETLVVTVSGVGNVSYKGNARVTEFITGLGSLKKLP